MSLNRIAALALLCASLAACATDPKNPVLTAKTPGDLYPLKAEIKPDQVALALHAEGLSAAQVQALTGLAARWREDGEDIIRLQAPHGGAEAAIAARVQEDARSLLMSVGVPAGSIQLASYDAADPKAPLLASFSHYEAKVAACGTNWGSLTDTEGNVVQANFGCAVSANIAAQIAHPSDIVHPRAEDAPDADRRQTVLGKYASGKATGVIVDTSQSGGITKVGQ